MRGLLRICLAAMPVLVAALARPAASDSCPEVERDERGKCAPRPAAERKPPLPARKADPKPDRTTEREADPKTDRKTDAKADPKPEPRIARKTELDVQGADIAGARVSLDGKPAGFAPAILEARPGRHLVELRKDGRAPYSTWVDAKQGERVTVAVALQPAGGAPPPIEPKQAVARAG